MIITIVGARPQFVKAAVVSKALRVAQVEEIIIHTGQHYDELMSGVFFKELDIPTYAVNLQVGSDTQARQTAQMLVKIEDFLLAKKASVKAVLLYGDTNSTLAGALAAAKLGIKIIHVESGLRSFNRLMPEEINRITTDHLSDILFCSSTSSVHQLKSEGISENVYEVGDVMYDALLQYKETATDRKRITSVKLPESFLLLTIHRPSNTDNLFNLGAILGALDKLSESVVWPIHPRTRKIIEHNGITIPAKVKLVEPFSYFEMLDALTKCSKVLTDSGGLQKEAYWMKKPCVTLRLETEWVETLHHDWNSIVGSNQYSIIEALNRKIDPGTWTELYGDGQASNRIAGIVKKLLY